MAFPTNAQDPWKPAAYKLKLAPASGAQNQSNETIKRADKINRSNEPSPQRDLRPANQLKKKTTPSKISKTRGTLHLGPQQTTSIIHAGSIGFFHLLLIRPFSHKEARHPTRL
jgi:hypothetical protein